ncbi:hypothetical protein ABK040_014726 [Willaertia magna]
MKKSSNATTNQSSNNNSSTNTGNSEGGEVKRGLLDKLQKKVNSSSRSLSVALSRRTATKLQDDISKTTSSSSLIDEKRRAIDEYKESIRKTRSVSIMVPKFDLARKQGISDAIIESARATKFITQLRKRKENNQAKAYQRLIVKRSPVKPSSLEDNNNNSETGCYFKN